MESIRLTKQDKIYFLKSVKDGEIVLNPSSPVIAKLFQVGLKNLSEPLLRQVEQELTNITENER